MATWALVRYPGGMTRRALVPLLAACIGLGSASVAGAVDDGGDYDRNLASFGAWGHPVPLDLQAKNGLVPGEGIVVRWVRPGGPAAQMGIQPGDVITSLNGNQIGSRADLRNTVIANAPGSAATAVVIHPGGDVAVLDGTFGERRTNRPLRPLTDDWEQRVKQEQLEELDRRARALQEVADAVAALEPAHAQDAAGAVDAGGASTTSAGSGASAASGRDASMVDGPWFASHRWQSPDGAPIAATRAAGMPAEVGAAADAPWRFTATVPSGQPPAPALTDL
jgi:membrane-associated protease RseP (regulator of RpoE activity)